MEANRFLRDMREQQGLGQGELAKAVGISQQALSAYESGKSTLSYDTLRKMAELLHINDSYMKEEKGNPFSSKKLIKMVLGEGLLSKVDFSIIHFIADANQKVDLLFLSPLIFKIVDKIARGTVFAAPIFAIACKDQDDNIFLLRKKNWGSFIAGERELQVVLNQKAKAGRKHINYKTIGIDEALYKKIEKWTVDREDIESLFEKEEMIMLTDAEISLIKKIRSAKISPVDIMKTF